jgi:hypothetical protein
MRAQLAGTEQELDQARVELIEAKSGAKKGSRKGNRPQVQLKVIVV